MDLEDKCDVVLDASDENFAADLMNALGVKPGEKINIMTPSFERTDGRTVSYRPTARQEYEALPQMTPENLKKVGCQIWDSEGGETHWLYPAEWYEYIPIGFEVIDIMGKKKAFTRSTHGNDIRFGALSYGFIQRAN